MTHELTIRHKMAGAVRAIKDAAEGWVLDVLGVPYGGPLDGKDAQGEFFSHSTDLWLAEGESRPAVYYHGYDPNGNPEALPETFGRAQLVRTDDKGRWFRVVLDQASKYAQRVWEAAQAGTARASSGALGHLVRTNPATGEIVLWPLGELSVFDTSEAEYRLPANDWAVALPAKALAARFKAAGLEVPEALAQAGEATPGAETESTADREPDLPGTNPTKNMEGTMDDKERTALAAEAAQAATQAVLSALKAEREETERKAAEREALKAEVRQEVEAEFVPARIGGFYTKRVTDLGFSGDARKAFIYWVRTGDEGAVKGALKLNADALIEKGSDASGGEYLVPEDLFGNITEKRDEQSIARAMGAFVMQTSRDAVTFPVEGTEQSEFGIVAEEGDNEAQEDEPTVAGVTATVYKFSKLVKVTEELLSDHASNLESFLVRSFARKMALTENKYFIAGTGSSQPRGVLAGGTAGLTLDAAAAIGAAEVPELFYKLEQPYREGAVWVMQGATEGYLRGLSGNPFLFSDTPGAVSGPTGWDKLMNRPVFNSAYMQAIAAGQKSMLIGNWQYYGIAERQGLAVQRLTELYAKNGYIGLLAKFRLGGNVLVAEAFQFATHPTS